jgi:hypothetical protein
MQQGYFVALDPGVVAHRNGIGGGGFDLETRLRPRQTVLQRRRPTRQQVVAFLHQPPREGVGQAVRCRSSIFS